MPEKKTKKKFAGVLTLLKKSGIFISELNNNQTHTTMMTTIPSPYDIYPKDEIDAFINYFCDYYDDQPWITRESVEREVYLYVIDLYYVGGGELTWGGGDSVDRERVYTRGNW